MGPLVTTEWLAGELGKPDLVLFDATKYLPNEPKDGKTEFLRAHIPGARYFDIDQIADLDTDLPHMVPTPGRFAKLIGALGVSNTSRTVFYDQKGLASAARGWWLMGLFGHDDAAVLDGGLPKWISEGRAVADGDVAAAPASVFRPDYRAGMLRGVGDMLRNVGSRTELVLDARAAGRFNGAVPEPRAGMRSGHIPGSASVPYTDLLRADGTFRPAGEVRDRFAAAGVNGSKPLVTSCGSAVTACILTLGLRVAGFPEGAVYDGSWTGMGRSIRHAGGGWLRMTDHKRGFRTTLSHVGRATKHEHGFVNPPLLRGSTVLVPTVAERQALQARRGERVLTYGTGGSATHGRWRTRLPRSRAGRSAMWCPPGWRRSPYPCWRG